MEWNGGSFKGVPVLPPPVACGKPVEAGTGLVYAVLYCNGREGKPLQYGDCIPVSMTLYLYISSGAPLAGKVPTVYLRKTYYLLCLISE